MFEFLSEKISSPFELKTLTDQEFEFIVSKDPKGIYDRDTRESIYWILEKLEEAGRRSSRTEKELYKKFIAADFGILLNEKSQVKGRIQHPGGVTVEGRFDGEIDVKETLTIEPTGVVRANVLADTVVCKGKILGDVQAKKFIRITSEGQVQGDIRAPSVRIEQGASFEGKCKMKARPRITREKPGWDKIRFNLNR